MAGKNRNKKRRRQKQPVSARQQSVPADIELPPITRGSWPAFCSPVFEGALPFALAALALCLLIAVSFFPALSAGFVWDDEAFTNAPPVQSWAGLWQIWFVPGALEHEGHYWPLLYTTFWLEHKLWGLHPVGYHIVNLLLHATVTLLLWRLLLLLGVPGAWLAAAVFAVHPVHVEPVAWVIGRKDVLAGLFSLACVLRYIRFVEDGGYRRYLGALALFMAGLLCKSIVVTLPISLLIWHWWKQGRVAWADYYRTLPFFLLGLFIAIADWLAYRDREVVVLADYSLIERALIAARALWFYAGKLVWPTDLAVIYPHWEVTLSDPAAWGFLIAACILAALLWVCRNRIGRGALAGALFFAVTLSPILGFIDYGYMQFSFVADRYQYFAGAGPIAILIAAATRILWFYMRKLPGVQRSGAWAVAISLPVIPLLIVMGTLTWNQSRIYRDNISFYGHIVSLNPQARNAHYNLGNEYRREGRREDALAAYRTSVAQTPGHLFSHLGVGSMTEELGRPDEAEVHYREALRINPRDRYALEYMGAYLLRRQRHGDALAIFQTLVEEDSESTRGQYGMGVALLGLNRHAEALRSFERALALDPSLEEARVGRERVLQAVQQEAVSK